MDLSVTSYSGVRLPLWGSNWNTGTYTGGLDSCSPNFGIVSGSSGVTCSAGMPEFVFCFDLSTSPKQPATDESASKHRDERKVSDIGSLLCRATLQSHLMQ